MAFVLEPLAIDVTKRHDSRWGGECNYMNLCYSCSTQDYEHGFAHRRLDFVERYNPGEKCLERSSLFIT